MFRYYVLLKPELELNLIWKIMERREKMFLEVQ